MLRCCAKKPKQTRICPELVISTITLTMAGQDAWLVGSMAVGHSKRVNHWPGKEQSTGPGVCVKWFFVNFPSI